MFLVCSVGSAQGCGYTVPVGEEGSLCGHWSSDLRFSDRSVDSRPPNLALFAMQTCLALDLGTTEVHPRRDRLCVSGFLEDQLLTVKTGAVSMVSKMVFHPVSICFMQFSVLPGDLEFFLHPLVVGLFVHFCLPSLTPVDKPFSAPRWETSSHAISSM